jgi:hypothetical protein
MIIWFNRGRSKMQKLRKDAILCVSRMQFRTRKSACHSPRRKVLRLYDP